MIGDSISADANFLRPIAAGQIDLGPHTYLGDTIAYFSGPDGRGANPFSVPSVAAWGGWMTETVLNPAMADGALCQPGETPLACELRLARPAVALIMLGTNDLAGGRSLDTYRANLEQIVQTCADAGVIGPQHDPPIAQPLEMPRAGVQRRGDRDGATVRIRCGITGSRCKTCRATASARTGCIPTRRRTGGAPPLTTPTRNGITVRNLTALQASTPCGGTCWLTGRVV